MRTGGYIRMSTDKQEDSPERQRNAISGYLERNRLKLYREYIDEGIAGDVDERPGFQQLLNDALNGEIQAIVIDEISRLSRKEPLEFLAKVAWPLKEANVTLHSVADGLQNWDTLVGVMLAAVHSEKTSSEVRRLSERVTKAYLKRLQRRDLDLGRPPFGYRRVWTEDAEGSKSAWTYEIVDDQAELVRRIFDLYIDRDLSIRDIAILLTRDGVQTPAGKTTWCAASVINILSEIKYAGYYCFGRTTAGKYHRLGTSTTEPEKSRTKGRKVIYLPQARWTLEAGRHPAIIDPERFLLAKQMREANRRRTTPVVGRGDFAFAKLLYCGQCGSPMTGQRYPNGDVIYRCSGAMTRGNDFCLPNLVREDQVLEQLAQGLRGQFNDDFIEACRTEAKRLERVACSDNRVNDLKRELSRLQRDLDRTNARMAEDLPDSTYRAMLTKVKGWEARKKDVEAELGEANLPRFRATMDRLLAQMETEIKNLQDTLQSSDRQLVRAAIRRTVAWVTVEVEPKAFGTKRRRYELVGLDCKLRQETPLSPPVSGSLRIRAADAGKAAEPTIVSLSTFPASCEQAYTPKFQLLIPTV